MLLPTMISLIVYATLAVLAVLLYIPKLKQFLSVNYRPEHKIATQKRKISVIIPARNESGVLKDLLESVAKQTYDRQYFDVSVIVDSEDDPSVALAEKAGAKVFVVPGQTCKGDALDGYFKMLEKPVFESYDAFAIVDADDLIAPDFVEELNNALEYGAQIFVVRKRIKNYLYGKKARSIFTNCSALTWAQLDDLANNYRTKKGIPVNMCGQGMLLRREIIEDLGGWPYRTLTEDYELRMDCFLKGFTSMYYPYAVIYSEEPVTHKDNYVRRLRWLIGFSQCDKIYKKKIKNRAKAYGAVTEGEREYFHSLIAPIIFIVTTIAAVIAGTVLCILYAVNSSLQWIYSLLLLCILPLVVLYLLLVTYAVMCIRAMRDSFKNIKLGERVATVLFAPLYILEYFPLYISSRFECRKLHAWQPTPRVCNDGEPVQP